MSNEIFAKEIRKTGFVLENTVAQHLKAAGWTVISNKYYVDDSEEAVREIDLLAYRVRKVQHFDVYTVLIISCKKSETNTWALLAREINLKDPNSDWWPLHSWSNDKALQFKLLEQGVAKRFHEEAQANGVASALNVPSVEVFAFQEMDKQSGRPQNDKPIFSAITSLMKAQAYELSALPTRKKAPCVYQFNLLSVVETDLVRLMFEGDEITCTNVDTEHYLARYIVRKKEIISRVRFVRSSLFAEVLQDYGRLHLANCKWFASECDAFYKDIVKDRKRTDVLNDAFKSRIQWTLSWRVERHFQNTFSLDSFGLFWSETERQLHVEVDASDDVLEFLNRNDEIKEQVAKALQEVFRYDGPFIFAFYIPF